MAFAAALPALTHKPHGGSGICVKTIEKVARSAGVSPLRQFTEIVRLNRRDTILGPYDYHRYQVYLPSHSWAEKRAFIGQIGTAHWNNRLSPPGLTQMRGFLSDKLAFTGLMAQLGLPTTQLQAAFSTRRSFGAVKTLRNQSDVIRFLTEEARFPLFGKPSQLRQGLGAVWIDSVDAAEDTARLGNGRTTGLAQLACEIAEHGATGFLFQDAVTQHPELSEMSGGPILSTLRIVTVVADDQPEVLYALWRLPPAQSMVDDPWQEDSLSALIDVTSGRLCNLRRGKGPATQWFDTHPVHGARVVGKTLPFWHQAAALARTAHSVVPVNGALGWDIAIGPDGPVLIECNENPAHTMYQIASGRGFLNPDFRPILERVLARNARLAEENRMDPVAARLSGAA